MFIKNGFIIVDEQHFRIKKISFIGNIQETSRYYAEPNNYKFLIRVDGMDVTITNYDKCYIIRERQDIISAVLENRDE
jgi:hypothetical protein